MNAEHEKEVIVALARLAEDAEEKGQKQTAGILYSAIADISYGKETTHDRYVFGYSIAAQHLSVVKPTNMTRTEPNEPPREPTFLAKEFIPAGAAVCLDRKTGHISLFRPAKV